jgi:hypothetical protein
MQGAAAKAALREATIDGIKTEGDGFFAPKSFHSGQESAQFLH